MVDSDAPDEGRIEDGGGVRDWECEVQKNSFSAGGEGGQSLTALGPGTPSFSLSCDSVIFF